jgi:hypothetical protein
MAERFQRRTESTGGNGSRATKLTASVSRVRRSRRNLIPSELIVSTSVAPSKSHPLSNPGHVMREERSVSALAAVLTATAKRTAVTDATADDGQRSIRSVSIQKRYKDGDEVKYTSSFNLAELPQAMRALKLAQTYVESEEAELHLTD